MSHHHLHKCQNVTTSVVSVRMTIDVEAINVVTINDVVIIDVVTIDVVTIDLVRMTIDVEAINVVTINDVVTIDVETKKLKNSHEQCHSSMKIWVRKGPHYNM